MHPGGSDGESLIHSPALIAVVDDDESVRESLPDLLRELGFSAQAFASADEFLKSEIVDQAGCLLLDIAMPGMSGPELQDELRQRRKNIPIVFITAQLDSGALLREHGVDCLFKPFSERDLQDALHVALGSG